MKTVFNRLGWLCICLLVPALSYALQILSSALIMGIAVSQLVAQGTITLATPENIIMLALQDQMPDIMPTNLLLYHAVAVLVFGLWYYFGFRKHRQSLPKIAVLPKSKLSVVMASTCLCVFANACFIVVANLAPQLAQEYTALMESIGIDTNVLTIIAALIFAPIGEEFLCRGVIFHFAQKVTNGMKNHSLAFWLANGIQALIFSLIHGNALQGIYTFVIGLVLGYIYKRYNRLSLCILGHFIINFLSTFFIGRALEPLVNNTFAGIVLVVASLVFCVLSLRLDRTTDSDFKKIAE